MAIGWSISDNDEEAQQWIERLSESIAKRAFSGIEAAPGATSGPTVSGITLVPNLNTITVKWNQANLSNLDYYEVQVSEFDNFVLPISQNQRNTQFTYQDGDPGETYYVRVRVKPVGGRPGPWSGTVNTATGLITTTHLGAGAATTITDNTIDLSSEDVMDPFNTPDGGPPGRQTGTENTVTRTYGNTLIKTVGGTVLPFITFQYSMGALWDYGNGTGPTQNEYEIAARREDTSTGEVVNIDSLVADVLPRDPSGGIERIGFYDKNDPPTHELSRAAVLGLGTPDDPGVGIFKYSVEVIVTQETPAVVANGEAYIAMQPLSINIECVELRS